MFIITIIIAIMLNWSPQEHIDENLFDGEYVPKSCEEGTLWTQTYSDNGYEITLICRCINNIISCENSSAELADQLLRNYEESIEYSCQVNSDCVIRDVRNCCGYYPKCINRNSDTKPELVQELCRLTDTMAICGFPTINSCVCNNNVCEGTM